MEEKHSLVRRADRLLRDRALGNPAANVPAWPGYGTKTFVTVDAPVVALTHVRIIDGSGAAPFDNATILISGGKIQAIENSDSFVSPPSARQFDFKGDTIIPGLVGMHDHMFYLSPGSKEMPFSFPRLYLASGVTTIRTAGAIDPDVDLRLKRQIDSGWLVGPKMHVTGPYLNVLSGPEQARNLVDVWADRGATSVKAYTHTTYDQLAAMIEEAHRRGIKVAGHLCAVGFREAAGLGIDSLEHGLIVDTEFDRGRIPDTCPVDGTPRPGMVVLNVRSPEVQAMIRDLVEHHVAVTSTLPVFETMTPLRMPFQPRILRALAPESREDYLDARHDINQETGSLMPALLKMEMDFERSFVRAGGLLLAGEDPTGNGGDLAGFGDQREIELLVEAGFTPIEAIHIATENGAEFLGESRHIGTLAAGKQADIVVINGDPSERISDIERVEIVFKDGVGYDSAKLIASVDNSVGSR
jgi:imidazolonepropionase-like amidohydrolase